MRGRKPKPTRLKLLNGNPGKRPVNRSEPAPSGSVGACPTWLSAEAKREWQRILPELERLGLATLVDRAALAAYCQAWAEFEMATKQLTREGRVRLGKPHPAVARQKAALQAIRSFGSEFGLTPASRSRIQSGGGDGSEGDDPFAAFLHGRQKKA